ncbi:MAG: hydroxypyruvate isomerase family protein [Armatimonadota bacterium]
MMKVDVCLESVFTDLPYDQRIVKIAEAGFSMVEFWFHDATFFNGDCVKSQAKDPLLLRKVCKETGVKINNMVLNAPDGSFGGSPVNKGDLNRYLDRLDEVIAFSRMIGCNKAITCSGNVDCTLTRTQMRGNLEKAFSQAAEIAEKQDFTLLVEPLNTLVDHEGYFLDSSHEAAEIVREINRPSLKLLYDVYHMQIMEGNIIANITEKIDIIGHFHSAGIPGRGEITKGELNYAEVMRAINSLGYKGAFGLEYFPKIADNSESLRLTKQYIEGMV